MHVLSQAAGTAVSSVTQGFQVGASTAVSTATSAADAAGGRHLLQVQTAVVTRDMSTHPMSQCN